MLMFVDLHLELLAVRFSIPLLTASRFCTTQLHIHYVGGLLVNVLQIRVRE
jgi:hypothetical protein